jgi:hypothetical protein
MARKRRITLDITSVADQVRILFLRKFEPEKDRGRSHTAIAREIGVSTTFLYDFLNGHRKPSQAILDWIGVELALKTKSRTTKLKKAKK